MEEKRKFIKLVNMVLKVFKGNLGKEKGSSLVEILFAVAILSILMIGILQMFSYAFVINQRSSQRTFQAYKCQQVAELIRLDRQLEIQWQVVPNNGVVFADNTIYALPYIASDPNWDYWGPDGANVIEEPGGQYRIFVRVNQPAGTSVWDVRIAAVSAKEYLEKGSPANPWEGAGNALRRVEYVTRIPQ